MRKILFLSVSIFAVLVLAGAGCIQLGGSSKQAAVDGGIFKSIDRGETWAQKSQIYAVGGERKNFAMAAIDNLVIDPSDRNTIYAIGPGTGLLYSLNAGDAWFTPEQLKAGTVANISVDAKNKCVVYAALGNLILKTEDCNRTFKAIYQEGRPAIVITFATVDPNNSSIVFAGNSLGDFLKSTDSGKSWTVAKRFENRIAKIIINPLDTKKIYLATKEKGIYRSADSGLTWTDLNQGLKQYGGAYEFHDLVLFDAKAEALMLASQYGLIKTSDIGVTWNTLTLLTPPNGADIRVIGVRPDNTKEIYYATPTTFYKSVDGGENWLTKKLPSARPPAFLLIDKEDTKTIYMGFGQQVKK